MKIIFYGTNNQNSSYNALGGYGSSSSAYLTMPASGSYTISGTNWQSANSEFMHQHVASPFVLIHSINVVKPYVKVEYTGLNDQLIVEFRINNSPGPVEDHYCFAEPQVLPHFVITKKNDKQINIAYADENSAGLANILFSSMAPLLPKQDPKRLFYELMQRYSMTDYKRNVSDYSRNAQELITDLLSSHENWSCESQLNNESLIFKAKDKNGVIIHETNRFIPLLTLFTQIERHLNIKPVRLPERCDHLIKFTAYTYLFINETLELNSIYYKLNNSSPSRAYTPLFYDISNHIFQDKEDYNFQQIAQFLFGNTHPRFLNVLSKTMFGTYSTGSLFNHSINTYFLQQIMEFKKYLNNIDELNNFLTTMISWMDLYKGSEDFCPATSFLSFFESTRNHIKLTELKRLARTVTSSLNDPECGHYLSDSINMLTKYKKENIKDFKVLELAPNGIEIPKKYRTIKELHDLVSIQANTIEKAANSEEFDYDDLIKRIDGIEVDGIEYVLPKVSFDLADVGQKLHNCVGSYKHNVKDGSSIIVFGKESGEVKYCLELNIYYLSELSAISSPDLQSPNLDFVDFKNVKLGLQQFRIDRNADADKTTVEKFINKLNEVFSDIGIITDKKEVFTAGFRKFTGLGISNSNASGILNIAQGGLTIGGGASALANHQYYGTVGHGQLNNQAIGHQMQLNNQTQIHQAQYQRPIPMPVLDYGSWGITGTSLNITGSPAVTSGVINTITSNSTTVLGFLSNTSTSIIHNPLNMMNPHLYS